MTKRLRTVKMSILIGILLISAIAALSTPSSARDKLYTFNSYVLLSYNPDDLSQHIAINNAVTVPLTVEYYCDVPEDFLKIIPIFTLRNSIIYGSPMPQQSIHLTIINVPDWANIYFSTPDHDIDFASSNDPAKIQVDLIISPLREAPSEPFNIQFKIEAEEHGRVKGKTMNYNINFQPAYIPQIVVKADKPTRMVAPREPVNINVEIKNNANYWTIVRSEFITIPENWSPIINPSVIEIAPGGTETIVLSVTPPYTLGWHDEIETIQINFRPEASPGGTEQGPAYPLFVKLNNRGFSTPGFELAFVFVALALFIIIHQKKRMKL